MHKILIPAILTVTILIAGVFAMAPIQEATTVHTTIIGSTVKVFELGAIAAGALAAFDVFTIDCNADYQVVGLTLDMGDGTYTGDDVSVAVGGDDYIRNVTLAKGGVDLLDTSSITAISTDDVTVTFFLDNDNGDEDIENARVSVVTSGSCTFVDTAG